MIRLPSTAAFYVVQSVPSIPTSCSQLLFDPCFLMQKRYGIEGSFERCLLPCAVKELSDTKTNDERQVDQAMSSWVFILTDETPENMPL